MNCQDITRILDEGDATRMTDDEQQALKLHLAFCPDCARDWELHAQLSATAIPPMSQELRATCRTLVIAEPPVRSRVRNGNRFILVGTLLVVAAAAAMLGTRLWKPDAAVTLALPPVEHSSQAATADVPLVEPIVTPHADTPAPPAIPVVEKKPEKSFTVAVMPLALGPEVAASRTAVESFYSSLLQKLRKVPHLSLVDPETPSEYRITVTGRATTRRAARSGQGRGLFATPGTQTANPDAASGALQWRVEIAADLPRQAPGITTGSGSIFGFNGEPTVYDIKSDENGVRYTSQTGSYLEGECVPSGLQSASQECPGPDDIAAVQVALLRNQVFPSMYLVQEKIAALQNPALDGDARTTAVFEFQSLARRGKDTWDAATVQAIVQLANATPDAEQRNWIWGVLQGVRSPALVQPLVAAMREDRDDRSSMAAMNILQSDYAADPVVRAAIETVAREDRRELLRQAAQRILYGDESWRAYVVSNLRNAGLPDNSRLAPLAYMTQSASLSAQLPAIMDGDTTAALASLIPGVWKSPDDSQIVVRVVSILSEKGHPAATALTAEALRTGPEGQLTPLIVSLVNRYRSDAEVRKLLDEASGRFPRLREMLKILPPAPAAPNGPGTPGAN